MIIPARYSILAIPCIAILLSACKIDREAEPVRFSFSCEEDTTAAFVPRYTIYLNVADYQTKLTHLISCDTIATDSLRALNIPASAENALGGHWAGISEYL